MSLTALPVCTHVVIARVTIFHLFIVFIVLDVVEKYDDFLLLLLHRRSVYIDYRRIYVIACGVI